MSYRDMEEDRDWDIIERTRWVKLIIIIPISITQQSLDILANVVTA